MQDKNAEISRPPEGGQSNTQVLGISKPILGGNFGPAKNKITPPPSRHPPNPFVPYPASSPRQHPPPLFPNNKDPPLFASDFPSLSPPPRTWNKGNGPHPHTFSLTKKIARFTKGQFSSLLKLLRTQFWAYEGQFLW